MPWQQYADEGKRVVGDDEAPPADIPRVSPKYVVSATVPVRPVAPLNMVEMEPWSAHGHITTSHGFGVKFPLPKNPKVDVLVFSGEGDVLN